MAMFRSFLYSKRRDNNPDKNSPERVFVDAPSSSQSQAQAEAPRSDSPPPPKDEAPLPLDDDPTPMRTPPPTPVTSPERVGTTAVVRRSLKPLHWNKVNKALEGSLWEELQPQRPPPDIDISELEQLFANTSPKTACSKEAEKRRAFSSIPEKVQLIDPVRADITEFMLSDVKLRLPYVVDAILDMDDSIIDQVENLLKICPTKEEMEILKNYTGDQDRLGQCEQYFLELMKVPRIESKFDALMFTIQFHSQVCGSCSDCCSFYDHLTVAIVSACRIRQSVKLKEVMKRILYLGNTLNQGTARGAAIGFKLDTLLKLTDTRASDSSATLMHYLCKLLTNKSPGLLDFHEDLASLEAASKIELKGLEEQMVALSNGMKKLKQELDASANDGPVSAGFLVTLKGFIDHAEEELTSVTNHYTAVKLIENSSKGQHALALYFGEDPDRCTFEQATQILFNFVRLFQKCHKENLERDELKRKESQEGYAYVVSPPSLPATPTFSLPSSPDSTPPTPPSS
ncbi:putative formin-like protein 15b [Bidens hawaiensis]|uniref:putative formin-like protein 15b n=1 Tax=Bidens hawaiensis TaxID=980011 RepID=UPI00404B2199